MIDAKEAGTERQQSLLSGLLRQTDRIKADRGVSSPNQPIMPRYLSAGKLCCHSSSVGRGRGARASGALVAVGYVVDAVWAA